MTIGDRIKELRESQNITQDELAKYISSGKQTIYKYENNIVTNIPSSKIERLAAALHSTPGFLMGWEEEEERDEINSLLDVLNETGIAKVKDYICDLVANPLYKK